MRQVLESIVGNWGLSAWTVASAKEALSVARKAQREGHAFVLAIVDCDMPEQDGFALVKELRTEKLVEKVILLLSPDTQPDKASNYRALGIDAFLVKPVKQSELLDAILSVAGKKITRERDKPEGREEVKLPPLRVLLAEDNPVNQALAVKLLQKRGHEVTVAGNGREVVEKWLDGHYDLILMDIQMPEMDGLEATRKIRAEEKDSHTPIIAMTAHAMKGDREKCLAAGMDGYVAKPVRAKELFRTIGEVLQELGRL